MTRHAKNFRQSAVLVLAFMVNGLNPALEKWNLEKAHRGCRIASWDEELLLVRDEWR